MNLNQLYYFVTLAETEHYSRAAEILSITQPSLSHAIARLEEELGAELFEKRGRNVVLTKYGKVFLEHARESLQSLEVGIKKTKALTGKNSGVIDLAYIYTLGLEFVPRLVRQFMEEHPQLNVQFRFTVGNTIEIIRGLKEEKYDVAFCSHCNSEIPGHKPRHGAVLFNLVGNLRRNSRQIKHFHNGRAKAAEETPIGKTIRER